MGGAQTARREEGESGDLRNATSDEGNYLSNSSLEQRRQTLTLQMAGADFGFALLSNQSFLHMSPSARPSSYFQQKCRLRSQTSWLISCLACERSILIGTACYLGVGTQVFETGLLNRGDQAFVVVCSHSSAMLE